MANSYLDELQNRLASYPQQLSELQAYKNLHDLLQDNGGNWVPPKISKNMDFISNQAKKYDDIFSKQKLDQKIFDEYKTKYWEWNQNYWWDNLKTAMPKMWDEYAKTWAEILNKIESLWQQYWNEKWSFMDKIKEDHDALKAWILWESQEQQAVNEWLTTRRWMWTKQMEDLTNTSIKNNENVQVAQADQQETAQLQQVASLYNQLLSNLIQQYKATKDQYVLWKIQNAVNILNMLKG